MGARRRQARTPQPSIAVAVRPIRASPPVCGRRRWLHHFADGPYPGEELAILSDLYDAGAAVGDSIMELIHHGRPLAADEGVYFALVQAHENAEPRVVAFVDRLRAG